MRSSPARAPSSRRSRWAKRSLRLSSAKKEENRGANAVGDRPIHSRGRVLEKRSASSYSKGATIEREISLRGRKLLYIVTRYSDAPTPSADFASNDSARKLLRVPRDWAHLASWTQEHLVGSRLRTSRCPTPPPNALPGLMEGMCARSEGQSKCIIPGRTAKTALNAPLFGKKAGKPLDRGRGCA